MDDDLRTILSFTIIAVAVVLFYLFLIVIVFKRRARAKAAVREQLLNVYNRDGIYLCYRAKPVGGNLIQFYGEPHGTSVRPGMSITDPAGQTHVVKEVYDSDRTNDPNLDTPDAELTNGMRNTAVVIEAASFNWTSFREHLRRGGGFVALPVR